jgi:uncharacterized membrane protein (Fun14 family)
MKKVIILAGIIIGMFVIGLSYLSYGVIERCEMG